MKYRLLIDRRLLWYTAILIFLLGLGLFSGDASMSFLSEFKEFAVEGNAIDMAVGIVLGASFNGVVNSVVNDILMPPIGLLAAWTYYKQGFVDFKIAAFICLGFFVGGLLGAKFATQIPDHLLRKIFGFVLLLVSLKMILTK